MTITRKVLIALMVAGLLGGWLVLGPTPAAGATILALSNTSSDSTPAAYLKGTMIFDVTGDVLTLTVTNDTASPHAYYINEIFFNATSNVTGLTLVEPGDWHLKFREDANRAAPFGKFDVALTGGVGGDSNEIAPGESITFAMTIHGTSPFAATNFATELSYSWGGQIGSLGAAKFIRGPHGDSARGNAFAGGELPEPVPEPVTVSFVGVGLLGVWLMNRRRGKGGLRPAAPR